jgi:hypothetical protein
MKSYDGKRGRLRIGHNPPPEKGVDMSVESGGRFDHLYVDRTRSMRASASKELAAPRRGSGVVSLTGGSSEMGAFVEKVLCKMGSSVVRGRHGLPVRPDR